MKKLLAIIVLGLLFSGNAYALIIEWTTVVKHKGTGEEFSETVYKGSSLQDSLSGGWQDSRDIALNKCTSKFSDNPKNCLFKTYPGKMQVQL